MENYKYTCEYCSKEYIPRRRKVQRFCCDSCRVKAHFQKNKQIKFKKEKGLSIPVDQKNHNKEKINFAGIGNAAIANVATEALKGLFTHEDNKPLTKGDFRKLIAQFKTRYELINNLPTKPDGRKAYFDNQTKSIIYLKMNTSWT
jgi:hypothetical protein